MDKVSTFDWLEDSPLPQRPVIMKPVEPGVCPPVGGLCDAQKSEAGRLQDMINSQV